MGATELFSVLKGEYGPIFDTIEMWACIQSLGIKPYRNKIGKWVYEYVSLYGYGDTIYEAASNFYKRIVNG